MRGKESMDFSAFSLHLECEFKSLSRHCWGRKACSLGSNPESGGFESVAVRRIGGRR